MMTQVKKNKYHLNLWQEIAQYGFFTNFAGLNSDISMDLESMDNTLSSKSGESVAIDFRHGMLSAMSDELTRLLLNLDAGNFKKMLDQSRNIVLEQEDEIKRSHQLIQQLESKVSAACKEFIEL